MAPGRSVGATTRAEKLLAPLDASGSVHHTWGRRSSWELVAGVRGEFRRRWQSWLTLAVLTAVVGGLVLAAAGAGRRTATAFPRFVAAHGYDIYIYNNQPVREFRHASRCRLGHR